MTPLHDRRAFLGLGLGGLAAIGTNTPARRPIAPDPLTGFPRQDPEAVEEMVRVAHGDLPRVQKLVEARPALAKAAVDWGFGDWEDALGAASHTGRVRIAELLLAHGARPTLFSAAMMGQLEVVKGLVAAAPGCQRILGPHSITLMAHAKVGGERAKPVGEFLERLGDADSGPTLAELSEADRNRYVGTYVFGSASNERLEVSVDKDGLSIIRPGMPFSRGLKHLGNGEFFPIGAESVRIRFGAGNGNATEVRVYDQDLVVTASRG
jgi:hypothetical protein